jgi:hypothetical protein
MLAMGTDVTRWFVQTTNHLHRTYQAWVGAMKGTKVALGRDIPPNKDTFGNALWLWARAQPPEKLAQMLEPYMDEWDRIWTAREGAAEATGQPWLPGSVRDQTPLLSEPPRRRARKDIENIVAHDEQDEGPPVKGRRKGTG